jgi:ATP-dependent Clp protease ATP-binding subunit ClpC
LTIPIRVGPTDTLGAVFERFTERARRVLTFAQEEARELNHSFIGTEHILLGLIREGDGVGAQALRSLGFSLQAVRDQVQETIGTAGTAASGFPAFTPRAKKVLELSLREALQLNHSYIGTEHILLGLVREGEGVAAKVLVSLGADLPRVRLEVNNLMSGAQERGRPARRCTRTSLPADRAALPALSWQRQRSGAHCGTVLHMFKTDVPSEMRAGDVIVESLGPSGGADRCMRASRSVDPGRRA